MYRVEETSLNARTIDILNVIRQNASMEYQSLVPEVTTAHDIPKVGEALFGSPALKNQFLNALLNRIALVLVKSATFNNPYASLKKGYLEFGETVEEVFVGLIKPLEYSAEKAASRELKRYMPDVRSAFHIMNWRVLYPITIQDTDLKRAFLTIDGVRDMISQIVESIYTSAKYDEFLLFKYLLIKNIANGKLHPVAFDATDYKETAATFRGVSNKLTFMSDKYNAAGVKNVTDKRDQYIFMDAAFNAEFDVEVLAAAFNMDKANFMGNLLLIDDWTTFDNERFDIIRANSDGIEEVTAAELALLADVKAVIVARDWFQVYDNETQFTEKYIANGLYWNYFYHNWKTVSTSPFENAVVLVDDGATVANPATLTFTVGGLSQNGAGVAISLDYAGSAALTPTDYKFVQTEDLTELGIGVQKYGGILIPAEFYDGSDDSIDILVALGSDTYEGTIQLVTDDSGDTPVPAVAVGDTITLTKSV